MYYQVETSNEGFLTLEAIAPKPSKSARLKLFDQNPLDNPGAAPLVVSGLVGEDQRIDWPAAAGANFFVEIYGTNTDVDVRVANLVHHNAQDGSEGRDTVQKPDVVDFVQLALDGPWVE